VGYLPVRLVAKALSIGVSLERPVIPVRGPASNCHFAQPCLGKPQCLLFMIFFVKRRILLIDYQLIGA
jgi:hypothetical protein